MFAAEKYIFALRFIQVYYTTNIVASILNVHISAFAGSHNSIHNDQKNEMGSHQGIDMMSRNMSLSENPIPFILEYAVKYGWTWKQTRNFILNNLPHMLDTLNFRHIFMAYCAYMDLSVEETSEV